MKKYIPSEIEPKWQKKWSKDRLYQAVDFDKRKKFYCLVEFPYPSGAGLHVGHVRSWSAMDTYSRKKRMEGYNVLYPMGWDAFGLPAENYAIQLGVHPSEIVPKNITRFKSQCKSIGLSFDWTREIDTTDPKYYKWTQWIFLKFFDKNLAYQADVPVNWCPACKTNLADEEVLADGTHERCGTATSKRMQKQWLLRITQYADRLLADLKTVDYPTMVAEQQINWIGRKEGINITYKVKGSTEEIVCFTTRPDTNFGATFIVLGPENPLIHKITKSKYLDEVKKYIKKTKLKSEIERIAEGRRKTGVFTGSFAINNLNGKLMPIWVSDFVLGHVGTGAVVGVPGHDKRDFEFAKQFDLEVIRVVVGKDGDTSTITRIEQVQEEEGKIINSQFLDGLDIHQATKRVMDYLEQKRFGKRIVSYHLRDWVFSRQHYWGEPIPIIHCPKCGTVPVPEQDLPVELPYLKKYEPTGTGQSPLTNAKQWLNVSCPKCKGEAKRETDTMPNWAGSNWYFLRYLDPSNDQEMAGKKKMAYWMPVDLYQGGFEHTTLHLLYSRFVYKFLYDIGVVPTSEPYTKRRAHGIVLGLDGRKMSKSFGNVINPDDIMKKFGADTLRIYEMFMGPFDKMNSWIEDGVNGVYHFLQRVWSLYDKVVPIRRGLVAQESNLSSEDLKMMHKTIKKVTEDIENIKFNTAVAALMEWLNYLSRKEQISKEEYKTHLLLLAPFAPHITEELWSSVVSRQSSDSWSIHQQSFPKFDKKYLEEEEISVAVQINGKIRDVLLIQKDIVSNKEYVEKMALESKLAQKFLAGKSVKKTVYIPGRIISLVVSS